MIKRCKDQNLKQTYMSEKWIKGILQALERWKSWNFNSRFRLLEKPRQLYFKNFTIVQGPSTAKVNKNNMFIYTWTENLYSKNANLIVSAVCHRLQNTNININITLLRLLAGGCGGQNKNSIISVLLNCVSKALKRIKLIFPIARHSPDRVFSNAEKRIKNKNHFITGGTQKRFIRIWYLSQNYLSLPCK